MFKCLTRACHLLIRDDIILIMIILGRLTSPLGLSLDPIIGLFLYLRVGLESVSATVEAGVRWTTHVNGSLGELV
jgi:hypothetical protein